MTLWWVFSIHIFFKYKVINIDLEILNNSFLFLSFSSAFLFDCFIGSKLRININATAAEFISLQAGDHRLCNCFAGVPQNEDPLRPNPLPLENSLSIFHFDWKSSRHKKLSQIMIWSNLQQECQIRATRATRMQHECNTSDTSETRARHEQHECNTSVTLVLHERHECDTSEKCWFW